MHQFIFGGLADIKKPSLGELYISSAVYALHADAQELV